MQEIELSSEQKKILKTFYKNKRMNSRKCNETFALGSFSRSTEELIKLHLIRIADEVNDEYIYEITPSGENIYQKVQDEFRNKVFWLLLTNIVTIVFSVITSIITSIITIHII